VTLGKNLKKVILKRIHYNKESSDLKSTAKSEHSLGVSHPEAGSWRKKSNDGEELSEKKISKNETNPNSFKRRRFNSDGAADENISTKLDTILINDKIIPSNLIKFRYSIKEMIEHFNASFSRFQTRPKFVEVIEEVCESKMIKPIRIFQEASEKRDRSKTMHYQANDLAAFNQKHINLPKNNRK
jgi:hypothetical protein